VAYAEYVLRFTDVLLFPEELAKLVVPGYGDEEREDVVLRFCEAHDCCVGRTFGARLQKAFRESLVEVPQHCNQDGNQGGCSTIVDYGALTAELQMLENFAVTTIMATTLQEKLHKANKDLASACGSAKPRNVHWMQMAAELASHKRAYLTATGKTKLVHDMSTDAVVKMTEKGRNMSRGSGSLRGGNMLYYYMRERRRLHTETGGEWSDRAGLERAWKSEYNEMDNERYHNWLAKYRADRSARSCDALDQSVALAAGLEASPPSSGGKRCGRIGDEEWPVAEEEVRRFMAENSKRGGVSGVGAKVKEERVSFIRDPGEEALTDTVIPPPDYRCGEKHPGYCPKRDSSVADRVLEIVAFLHLHNTDNAATGGFFETGDLEPMVEITVDGDAPSKGVWVYAGARKQNAAAVWLSAKWLDGDIGDEDVKGRYLALVGELDSQGRLTGILHKTSWALAVDIANAEPSCGRLKYRHIEYRLLSSTELRRRELLQRDASRFMMALEVKVELWLGDAILELALAEKAARSEKKKVLKGTSDAGMANLAALRVLRAEQRTNKPKEKAHAYHLQRFIE